MSVFSIFVFCFYSLFVMTSPQIDKSYFGAQIMCVVACLVIVVNLNFFINFFYYKQEQLKMVIKCGREKLKFLI